MHRLICAVGVSLCLPVQAAQLVLELEDGVTRTWDSEQLLLHPELRELRVPNDVAYGRSMRYKALPFAVLLNDASPEGHLQVLALDGFKAELAAAPLLARDGTSAWIAVEDPSEPWPQLPSKQGSAGPFYLVWIDADPQVIGPEQWPYQIARIRLVPKVVERFPTLRPADNATPDVHEGFVQFQKHCLSCHRLNEAGDARIGPDLNLPHNPTEYFAGDFLRR